jgi:hypothetical protein
MQNFTTPQASYFELGHTVGYTDGYTQACKDQQDIFTKAEIDFLVHELSKNIALLENVIDNTKQYAEVFYSLCDPYDETTSNYFKLLNKTKNNLRKYKKKHSKLATIQNKLKKMRGV